MTIHEIFHLLFFYHFTPGKGTPDKGSTVLTLSDTSQCKMIFLLRNLVKVWHQLKLTFLYSVRLVDQQLIPTYVLT